jgi:hypothetical protein
MEEDRLKTFREFLKDGVRKKVDFRKTDQSRGFPLLPSRSRSRRMPPGGASRPGRLEGRRDYRSRRCHREKAKPPALPEGALTLTRCPFSCGPPRESAGFSMPATRCAPCRRRAAAMPSRPIFAFSTWRASIRPFTAIFP